MLKNDTEMLKKVTEKTEAFNIILLAKRLIKI